MSAETGSRKIREAVGIFNDAESLGNAIDDLLATGIDSDGLGLLASEKAVEDTLGDLYARTNTEEGTPGSPAIAFVERESLGQAGKSLGGGLFFVGTSGVMGGVVASSAVLGGALLAAVGGVVAVGVIGALVASVIHQSDAEFLQQQVDEGKLLLFVRIIDSAREQDIKRILNHYTGTDVKLYDIDIERREPVG